MEKMEKEQKRKMARLMANNDRDWYAVLSQDGSVDLKHSTGLSSILECGMPASDYGIKAIVRCGIESLDIALDELDEWERYQNNPI